MFTLVNKIEIESATDMNSSTASQSLIADHMLILEERRHDWLVRVSLG